MKRAITRVTFVITVITIITFSIKGYQLNKLIKKVDNQVVNDKNELAVSQKQLTKLQWESTQMNSPEYIERVAREELGMVKEDDIVFREKK